MIMKTYAYKGRDGWQVCSQGDLGNNLRLKVDTYKNGRTIVTYASVCTVDGAFETHKLYDDFFVRLEASKIRATERNVRDLHNMALSRLPEIMPEIAKQYGLALAA